MKKSSLFVLLLLTLAGFSSCTKEIKFKGEQTDPKLVLYSLARAGEPLEVEISNSAFFLDAGPVENYSSLIRREEGSVKLYVNDNSVPYYLTYREPVMIDVDGDGLPDYQNLPKAPLYYDSTYVPAEGDRLRLVASFPGFDEVSAEVQVPVCTALEVNSAAGRESEGGEMYSYRYYDLTLTVHRGLDPQCYYGIRPYVWMEYTYDEGTDSTTFSWDLQSDDFLFQGNGSGMDQLTQLLNDDDVSMLFADSKIPAADYTFRCNFYGYNADYLRDNGVLAVKYYLIFTTMTPDLYYYRTSLATANGDSSFSLFSEATSIYSNVLGGYGCFCAASAKKIALDL